MPVSIDFYGNDISNVEDNCIEADGGAHNIRIFRNRCFNHGHRALSVQPMFGGPVYFIRNIVYHAPEGGAVKFTASSSGIVVYHNTLIAPVKPMLLAASNVHYRNNLILGKSETLETFAVETNTNYSSSDYNGFRPNEGAEFSFEWSSPPLSMRANFPGERRHACRSQQQAQLEASVAGAAAIQDAEGIQRRNGSGHAQRPRGLRRVREGRRRRARIRERSTSRRISISSFAPARPPSTPACGCPESTTISPDRRPIWARMKSVGHYRITDRGPRQNCEGV